MDTNNECRMKSDTPVTNKELTRKFEVSIRKTFNHPVNEVFDRAKDWLETEKRTEMQQQLNQKRLQCKWLNDDSKVSVEFNKKTNGTTEVVIQHNQLASESDADVMRNFWTESMPQMVESF